jgi:hypothetical protein
VLLHHATAYRHLPMADHSPFRVATLRKDSLTSYGDTLPKKHLGLPSETFFL